MLNCGSPIEQLYSKVDRRHNWQSYTILRTIQSLEVAVLGAPDLTAGSLMVELRISVKYKKKIQLKNWH